MRLHIKTKDFRLHLLLPTWLVLSKPGLTIALWACRRYVTLPPHRRAEVFRLTRRLGRQSGGVSLVVIHTKDGEEIRPPP